MKTIGIYHIPALLNETVDLLNVRPGKKYIDATLGGSGHSQEIVRRGGSLLGIDVDPEAISNAIACPFSNLTVGESHIAYSLPPKFALGNFANIDRIAIENGFEKVDGILFDLGVSSHQLETPYRGFSFNQEGDLDMRMNPDLAVSAKDLVNGLTEFELWELFSKLGEEKLAKKYARAIVIEREKKKIEKTNELSQIILKNAPKRGRFDRTHPATRVFQALRIAVNDELNSLRVALPKALKLLNVKGRLAVLSFHSLEDAIIKQFFQQKAKESVLEIVTDKPVTPSLEESESNPRARSAKLRVAEKVS